MKYLDAPTTLPVKTLKTTNPVYDSALADTRWALYKGGELFKPEDFLLPRAEEQARYEERCARAYYLNYMGEIVDFFVANLFMSKPGYRVNDSDKIPDFFSYFLDRNCDGNGTDFLAFNKDRWVRSLVQQASYTWVDMPAKPREDDGETIKLKSIADVDKAGLRDAYLIKVDANELLDWDLSDEGRLLWATIYQQRVRRSSPFSSDRTREHEWTTLMPDGFVRYKAEEKLQLVSGEWKSKNENWPQAAEAALDEATDYGFGMVPLVRLGMPDALAIGPKLDSTARHMIELDNAIAWQLFTSLFAMPVVKTAKDFNQTMGDGYYIHLDPEDEFTWSEPTGTATATAQENREKVKQEMFRVVHQMAQALNADAGMSGRSADSKRRDSNATETVLETMGELARDHMREVLEMVSRGRGESGTLDWNITGMEDFDVEDLATFLDNQTKSSLLPTYSVTFAKMQAKKLVRRLDPELSDTELATIDKEIDAVDVVLPGDEAEGNLGKDKDGNKKPGGEKKPEEKKPGDKKKPDEKKRSAA